jgi:hypothetical protein
MSLSIRRATPCFALIVAVLVAACSGGDPVSPAGITQVPSLNKARTTKDTTTTTTTASTKCPPPVLTVEGDTTTTSTTTTGSTTSSKKCSETAPWH